jgi:hypothetical protein
MKQTQTKKLALFLAATLSALSLSGCGRNDGTPAGLPVGGYANGVFATGGCIPIGGQIPFQAQGIQFDSANIRGGRAQSGQQIGNIIVGQGPVVGGPFSRSGANGTISMDLVPVQAGYQSPQGWSYYNGPVNGQGFVQISPLALQELQMLVATGRLQVPGATPTMGNTPGYPTGYPMATRLRLQTSA